MPFIVHEWGWWCQVEGCFYGVMGDAETVTNSKHRHEFEVHDA